MPYDPAEALQLLAVGLFAGVVGGLVGVGGSIIVIPVLTLLMDRNQHVSQAAAMIINFFVAAPALFRHHQADTVRWKVIVRMLPFGVLFIVVGVELSNLADELLLRRIFGLFLLYVIALELWMVVRRPRDPTLSEARVSWPRDGFVGGLMGLGAGILGIGGGPIAVPLLNRVSRLPLREAISATTAVMCLTAAVGAVRKNLALGEMGLNPYDSLIMATYLAPTAMIGSMIGASLMHSLPLKWVRLSFILLVAWASVEMLALG
ncbi:MAG: sulfite exporter TauE/SafE family protein [Planctomycetota bacterium]|jgi:uncharacterized membrane protein YfcA